MTSCHAARVGQDQLLVHKYLHLLHTYTTSTLQYTKCMFKGTGFTGYRYGFSPKITHLWNKNKIKNLYIKKQSKFSPDYGPNDIIGLLTGHVNNKDVRLPRLSRSLYQVCNRSI